MVLAMHLRNPRKSAVWTLSPSTGVSAQIAGNLPEDVLSLDLVG